MGFPKPTVQKVQNTICFDCTCNWYVLQELSPHLDLGQLLERLLSQPGAPHNVTQVPEIEVTHVIQVVNLITPPASPQAAQKKRPTPNTAHVPRKRPVPAVFSKPHSVCTVLGLLHTGPFGPGAAQLEWSDINRALVTANWSVPRAMVSLAGVPTDTAIEPICIIHRELWPVVDARALVNDTGDEWGVLTHAGQSYTQADVCECGLPVGLKCSPQASASAVPFFLSCNQYVQPVKPPNFKTACTLRVKSYEIRAVRIGPKGPNPAKHKYMFFTEPQ